MAYTPNEWGVGNLITASKMNKIERQLVENTSDLDDIRNGVTVPTYEEFETLRDDVAAEYDNTKTYSVGDYVIYNTQLYKCKTAITSAETWTAAHWDTVEVGEELQRIEGKNEEEVAELKSALDNKVSELESSLIPFPTDENPKYGDNGQLLRTLGNGKTQWVDEGLPTDEQTAEAISNWLEDHPEATTTVEDGSLGLSKFTADALKTLTDAPHVYNVLNYGISSSGSGNQAPKINELIHSCNDYDTIYFPNDGVTNHGYRITEPIIIDKPICFICDGEIRGVLANAGYCVEIKASYAKVYIRQIGNYNANTSGIKIANENAAVERVNIEFDRIAAASSSLQDLIRIESTGYSASYININGRYLYGNQNINCIGIVNNGSNTIGEITINNIRINNAKNGIYAADEYNGGEAKVSSVCLNKVAFETNQCGMHYKNVRTPSIINCRTAEQASKKMMKLEGTIVGGLFLSRQGIKISQIELINMDDTISWRSAFYIDAPIYISDTDSGPKIGALIYGGKMHCINQTFYEIS